ncbi:MAG: hypothetical protein AB1423_14460 [Pseudomonadota bacterium]
MASEIVQLILQAKDLASETITRVRGGMEKFSATGHSVEKSVGSLREGVSSFASSFKGALVAIGAAAAAYKGFQALVSLPLKGLEFAKEMETARLGIASIIAATQDLTAQDGKRLQGMEKLNAAQKIARDLMQEIQIAGLETVATTEELVTGFQVMLGPASEAGLTLAQTKDITVSIVQAMGAMGIEMRQLSAEGRSLLDGSIIPTQDRLAVALGITGEMVKKWKEQGVLYDELTKKLEPFKLAGADLANTWAGLISNLKEGIAFVASRMTGGIFEDVKSSMKTILDIFIDLKNFDVGSGIKDLVEGVKEVGKDIGYVIRAGAEKFVELLKSANDYVRDNKQELSAIWETFKQIGGQLWEMITQILTFGGEVANAGIKGGIILDILKIINIVLASINDIVGWIIMGFKTIAAIVYNTVVPPLAEAARIVGEILRIIPGFEGIGDYLISMAVTWRQQQVAINQELLKSAEQYRDGIAPHTQKALQINREVEESLKKQNAALDEESVKIEKVRQTYEGWREGITKGSAEYLAIQAQEIKALEARVAYEKALLDKELAGKILSQEEYARRVQELDDQVYRAKLEQIDMMIAAEKKGGESHYQKVVELETSKTELTLKHSAERTKTEIDAIKEVQQVHEDDLKNWQSLQELKLQSLKSRLDLQNTVEETMVEQGLMRQSTLYANQLERLKEYYAEKIRIIEEGMAKAAEREGYDSGEYKKLYAEREQLQNDLERQIIQSEANIADARIQEEREAAKFIAEITKDRAELQYQQQEEMLEKVQRYYNLGLISAEQYYDALSELDKTYSSRFKLEMQERTEQLNLAMDIVRERRQRLEESISGLMTDTWEDVKRYFGDWKTAVKTTVEDVQYEIEQFMDSTTMKGYETFWNAQLYGRRLVEMTGTTIYEWSQRVVDYINYIKGLVQSLEDYIMSLRMQLAQLRDDRLAELELWYAQEKKKFEEQYKDLEGTQEYYEGLEKLAELYAEKKKKILEDLAKAEEDYREGSESTGGKEGSAGGGFGGGSAGGEYIPAWLKDLPQQVSEQFGEAANALASVMSGFQGMSEIKVSQAQSFEGVFRMEHMNPDRDYTRRWIRETFMPELEAYLLLKGIKLE